MGETEPGSLDAARALRKLRFDGTINLGHILTFAGLMFVGVAAWSGMDKRVLVLEEARKAQVEHDATREQALRDQLSGINNAVGKIDDRLQRMNDRLIDNGKSK